MKRHIPNIITLGNLTCGVLSILQASLSNYHYAVYFIFLGLFLDFFDGFFARILKVDGELGKQLDSLADMVTFGVAPGLLVFYFSQYFLSINTFLLIDCHTHECEYLVKYLPYLGLIIPVLSAIRLAKFNIDTNQSDQFIGLPTPANAVFISSIILVLIHNVDYKVSIFMNESNTIETSFIIGLLGLSVLMSLMLNANIPLIALKFKSFGWRGNEARFTFLGIALLAIIVSLLISNIFVSIPIIILLYLIISIINNYTKKSA